MAQCIAQHQMRCGWTATPSRRAPNVRGTGSQPPFGTAPKLVRHGTPGGEYMPPGGGVTQVLTSESMVPPTTLPRWEDNFSEVSSRLCLKVHPCLPLELWSLSLCTET